MYWGFTTSNGQVGRAAVSLTEKERQRNLLSQIGESLCRNRLNSRRAHSRC
jgi:hypothetical protein